MSVSSTSDSPHFIIDSDDRIAGRVENFDVKIDMKVNNNYNSVAMIHAGIPKSYYNIDDLNSDFIIRENGVNYAGNLLSGEYTKINLPALAKTAFDTVSSDNNPASPWTYDFVWDSFLFRWRITVTGHASRPLVPTTSGLVFQGHTTHDLLGFNDDETYNYDVTGLLVSSNVANFNRTNYITLKSNICHNDGNSNPDSQILARIPVKNTPFGELITYDLIQIEDGSKLIANNKSNVYSFSLYDDHESELFLNGRDWFFTLMAYEYNKLAKLELEEIELVRRKRRIDLERRIDEIDPNKGLTIKPPTVEEVLIEDELLPRPVDLDS